MNHLGPRPISLGLNPTPPILFETHSLGYYWIRLIIQSGTNEYQYMLDRLPPSLELRRTGPIRIYSSGLTRSKPH